MTRFVILLALLTASCATKPPTFPDCPPSLPVPSPTVRKPSARQIAELEIRVEIAREAERARGDACAETVDSMRAWIGRR